MAESSQGYARGTRCPLVVVEIRRDVKEIMRLYFTRVQGNSAYPRSRPKYCSGIKAGKGMKALLLCCLER